MSNSSIDHIVPRSEGGTDHTSNLGLSCLDCNREKGSLSEAEFREILRERERW